MTLSTAQFWKLCVDSRLLSPAECQRHDAAYRSAATADPQDGATLSQWLIGQKALTQYQATVLLSGRAGPFIYGDYRIDDVITSGRRAGLFRATHLPTTHHVAIWPLTGPSANDPARIMLARQKVDIARRAAHPLLCACHELVELETARFIVLEDLAGQSLEECLAQRGSLPLPEACRIAQLAALALTCLHEQGQAHGEMRPSNVWLGTSGEVKVLQVPLSRDPMSPPAPPAAATPEAEARLSAVADYTAPEVAQGGRAVHPPADVYALGCTLYEMLSSQPPFAGGDWRRKAARHALEPVQPLTTLGVPALLSKLVLEMLGKEPASRPPLLQVAKGLVRFAGGAAPVQVPEPPALNAYERLLIQRQPSPPAVAKAAPPPPSAAAPPPKPVARPVTPPALPAAAALSASQNARRRVMSKRARQQYVMLGGALLIFFTAVTLAVVVFTREPSPTVVVDAPRAKEIRRPLPPTDAEPQTTDQVASVDSVGPTANAAAPRQMVVLREPSVLATGVEEAEDDGRSLWASPTKGSPLKLNYLAPALQAFVSLRPAELLEHPEGEKILAAIGTPAAWVRQQLEAATGVRCADIEQLTIGIYDGDENSCSVSLAARLRQSTPLPQLRKAWNDPEATTHEGRPYYVGKTWAYYLPHSEDERMIVIADPVRIIKIIEADGAPPPLPPRLDLVRTYSDDLRLLTIGFLPQVLFYDDHGLMAGLPMPLRQRCTQFLGDTAKAALLSIHLGDALFAELRLRSGDEKASMLSDHLRRCVAAITEEGQVLAVTANEGTFGRKFLFTLPQMMQALIEYARVGTEDDHAVLRWYLPVGAAEHLTLAAGLALGRPLIPAVAAAPSASPGKSSSVAVQLEKPIDLAFPRDTLESAIRLLSREMGVPIEILGGDLQLEGITKNQSFGLDEWQRPAGEILRKILLKANPDGKLVYVIKPRSPGGPDMLFLTTRAAAKKRGDPIPAELEQKNP